MKTHFAIIAAGFVLASAGAASADGLARGSIKDAPDCCAPAPWSGVYIGAFAGWTKARDSWSSDETSPADEVGPIRLSSTGFTAGGLIGANMQVGRAVWGVELDVGWNGASKKVDFPTNIGVLDDDPDSIRSEINWNGHARLRFGLPMGRWMPFLAGGLAFADTTVTFVDGTDVEKRNLFRVGASLGGGADFVLRDGLLGRVEFIHDRYAPTGVSSAPQSFDQQTFDLRTNTIRGALIYKLN